MTSAPSRAAIEAAIKTTEYKYFGDYEMSDDQRAAVDVLVECGLAIAALEASSRQEERLRSALERLVSVADLAADTINTSLMDEAIQQARAALEPPHAKEQG